MSGLPAMLRCGVLTASLLTASVTLHGCGGGDDPTPSPSPSPSPIPSPSPPSPGPSPAPVPPPSTTRAPLPACKQLDATGDPVVDELNRLYTSFDEKDATSPAGVTIRMVGSPTNEDARFFCGSKCHGGYPDCRVSASLYNNKMMITHDDKTLAVAKAPNVVVTMKRIAGILYNQASVEASMAKCVYMYDGATFGRVNHGCGCASKSTGCDCPNANSTTDGTPDSAYCSQDCKYKDQKKRNGVIKGSCKNNTEESPDVQQCWCKTTGHRNVDTPTVADMTTTSQQCFFRGAAIAPASGPRHMLPSELHDMVIARIHNQANPPTEEIKISETTTQTRYKQEYWNEIVIEGEELRNRLNENPLSAYSAFVYVGNNIDGKKRAQKMQRDTYEEYGGPLVPIVELDTTVDVRCNGPFRVKSNMPTTTLPTTTTTWDGKTCAKYEHAQCGGKTWKGTNCCDGGLVCAEQNPYYFECRKPTTTTTTEAPSTTTPEATSITTTEAPSSASTTPAPASPVRIV